MLTDTQREELRPLVRTLQIIVGALALGVLNFFGVVLLITHAPQPNAAKETFISYMAVGCGACALVASFIVPLVLAGTMRKAFATPAQNDNVRQPAQMYQTLLIIRCAILEGAIFFCLVSYMLEQQPISLAAAIILLLVMLTQFPTASRVETRIENEMATAEQMGQLQ